MTIQHPVPRVPSPLTVEGQRVTPVGVHSHDDSPARPPKNSP
jgi:hypothetical protein